MRGKREKVGRSKRGRDGVEEGRGRDIEDRVLK